MQASQSLATENKGLSPPDSLDQEHHCLAPQPTLCAGMRFVPEAGCYPPYSSAEPTEAYMGPAAVKWLAEVAGLGGVPKRGASRWWEQGDPEEMSEILISTQR